MKAPVSATTPWPKRMALLNGLTGTSIDLDYISDTKCTQERPIGKRKTSRIALEILIATGVTEIHHLGGIVITPAKGLALNGEVEVKIDGVSVLEVPIQALAQAQDPDKLPWKKAEITLFQGSPVREKYSPEDHHGFMLPHRSVVEIWFKGVSAQKKGTVTIEASLGLYGTPGTPKPIATGGTK